MSGRQGGKLKPLKAPKREKRKDDGEDEDGVTEELKAKQRKDAAALRAMKDRAAKGGPLGAGLKKSGKK